MERLPGGDPCVAALAHLQQESLRLSRLVDELMILAHSDAGLRLEMEPVELDSVLLQAVAQREVPSEPSRIAVAGLEPVVITGNADRLHQLLTILLDNALKYSTPEDGAVEVSLRRRGERVELSVRDRGIGIPSEALPHLFERFYRVDQARGRDPGGSGLGLSIARWIATQHDATIEVESEPDEGTTVTVRFPTATVAASGAEATSGAAPRETALPVQPARGNAEA